MTLREQVENAGRAAWRVDSERFIAETGALAGARAALEQALADLPEGSGEGHDGTFGDGAWSRGWSEACHAARKTMRVALAELSGAVPPEGGREDRQTGSGVTVHAQPEASARPLEPSPALSVETPCKEAHTWTQQHDGDPERGTPCDCGKKLWGIPLVVKREHEWQFYGNGTFCRRCGTQIGSGYACR